MSVEYSTDNPFNYVKWKSLVESFTHDKKMFSCAREWLTDVQLSDAPHIFQKLGYQVVRQFTYLMGQFTLLQKTNTFVEIDLSKSNESLYLRACTHDENESTASNALAELRDAFPESIPKRDEFFPLFFSFEDDNGQGYSCRRKLVPIVNFDAIVDNYPQSTKMALNDLVNISLVKAVESGKLILFHGKPGGGKTFAIRALASAWSSWSTFYYILDPENFLGHRSKYLLSMLMNDEPDDRWKVFVLEDNGELLSANAKERVGQALARLLNAADGLIGQSTKCLFIITTNEDMFGLHQAIVRSGRCLARIKFETLSVFEANRWLKERGVNEHLTPREEGYTIAELFAKLGETRVIENEQQIPLRVEVS